MLIFYSISHLFKPGHEGLRVALLLCDGHEDEVRVGRVRREREVALVVISEDCAKEKSQQKKAMKLTKSKS